MLPRRPTVSVVIPTLNEAFNLPLILPYLPIQWIDEIILVDGRSTDDTVEIARCLLPSIKVIMEKKRGKGMALRAGFSVAKGDIVVTLDADGSHDPREIPRMIQALMDGADFVKGSRFTVGGGTTDMPRIRKIGNWALGTAANLLFNGIYTDLCYGYHAFWRYCLEVIDRSPASGFEIDAAIYVRLLRENMRVVEVPSFEGYRFYGVGKLQAFPDGWRILKTILGEWIDSLRNKTEENFMGFRGYCPILYLDSNLDGPATIGLAPSYEIELIHSINEALNFHLSRSVRLQRLLEITLEKFCATSGSVILLDEQDGIAEGSLAYEGRIQPHTPQQLAEIVKGGLAGWVIEHHQSVLISSTVEDPRWLRRPWENVFQSMRSAICVPLVSREGTFGVLTLVRPQKMHFTRQDLALLSAIVTYASGLAANPSKSRRNEKGAFASSSAFREQTS
jgi:glycosyltransferase involved in cell wall biosynthesis